MPLFKFPHTQRCCFFPQSGVCLRLRKRKRHDWRQEFSTRHWGTGTVLKQASCFLRTVYYYGFLILTSTLYVVVPFIAPTQTSSLSLIVASSPRRYAFLSRCLICVLSLTLSVSLSRMHTHKKHIECRYILTNEIQQYSGLTHTLTQDETCPQSLQRMIMSVSSN